MSVGVDQTRRRVSASSVRNFDIRSDDPVNVPTHVSKAVPDDTTPIPCSNAAVYTLAGTVSIGTVSAFRIPDPFRSVFVLVSTPIKRLADQRPQLRIHFSGEAS